MRDAKEVKDLYITDSVKEIFESLANVGGFQASHLHRAYEIMKEFLARDDCTKFLSFPACIVATGVRGILKEFIKRKMFDVIITTCGSIDHDIARSLSKYYCGSFDMDDTSLRREGIHRLGNVLVPQENYGSMVEKFMQEILPELYNKKKVWGVREIVREIGKKLPEDSILHWAYRNDIPVYVPGYTDGAFGSQLWSFYEIHRDFVVNSLLDEHELADIVMSANCTAALIIGGGISKHHTIWWNQFRDGLDYAVYITTAPEWDGSLSGARMREAISWHKLKEKAKYVTLYSDATVVLPFLASALLGD